MSRHVCARDLELRLCAGHRRNGGLRRCEHRFKGLQVGVGSRGSRGLCQFRREQHRFERVRVGHLWLPGRCRCVGCCGIGLGLGPDCRCGWRHDRRRLRFRRGRRLGHAVRTKRQTGDEQRGGRARQPRRSASRVRRGCAEQPAHAQQERAAVCRQRERRPLTKRLEIGKRAGVGDRITTQADGEVVAAVLALRANASRQPPDGGVIEEQRLDERLQEIDQIVVAPDVRELVRQNRLELLGRQAGQRARRHQHDRLDPADDGRNVNAGRFENRDAAREVKAAGEADRHRLPRVAGRRNAVRAQPLDPAPPGEQTQAQDRDARQPHEQQRRQNRFTRGAPPTRARPSNDAVSGVGTTAAAARDWCRAGVAATAAACASAARVASTTGPVVRNDCHF